VVHAEKPEIEAARKGGDIDRPIDGEDLSAESPAVVRRWLRAYAELESLETELLDILAARTAQMSNDARREAAETNLPVLMSQLERFRIRRDYWRQRQRQREMGAPHDGHFDFPSHRETVDR
jgi:hypothetical protein